MSHEGTAPTGQDQQQQTQDRKALLLEQFNQIENVDAGVTTEKQTDAAPAVTDKPIADGRTRDQAGKFVPKEKLVATGPATPAASATVPVTVAAQPWDAAPATWKKDKHPLWQSMTPEARQYAYEQEEKRRVGVEALAPKAELADKINEAAAPYMQTIRGLGLELPQAVAGLMKVDHDLRTLPYEQKLAVLQRVAGSYGIDLSGQLRQAQPAFDPNFQAIQNELLTIKGQFTDFTQQQEQQQNRAALDEIQKFAKQAEHFDEVRPLMVQLLQGGIADGIEDAYQKAINLTPDLFDKIQSAKQAAADAEKKKAADEAAKRARTAAVSPKSAAPGAQKTDPAKDRRSMLREQFDSLSDRL